MDFNDLFPEDNPELLNDYIRNAPIEEINSRNYLYYGPGNKIIHMLVIKQKIKPLKILIKRPGFNINVVDYWNETALHYGITYYDNYNSDLLFEIIKLLIDNGISLNIKNKGNNTALELSIRYYRPNKINNYILCALNKRIIFVLLIPISFSNKFKKNSISSINLWFWLSQDLIRILFEFL
jgi:hypothetical protein